MNDLNGNGFWAGSPVSVEIRCASDPISVRGALKQTMEAIPADQFDESERGLTELIVAEVLNNIVEHAYLEKPGNKIWIRMRIENGEIDFDFIDQGISMPNQTLPAYRATSIPDNVGDMPEGGWGWMLIHDLAEDLSYQRLAEDNHLCFRLSRRQAFVA